MHTLAPAFLQFFPPPCSTSTKSGETQLSYTFAHAIVPKHAFPHFAMYAAVARRGFSLCWMNPLAGFGGSITRICSETCILRSWNCSAHCTGKSTLPKPSPECHRYTVLCNSGSRWSAESYCVLQLKDELVCILLLCFATIELE